MQRLKRVALGILVFVTLVTVAPAQENNIKVSGTVTDPSGAYVSGAVLKVNLEQCKCSDCKNPIRCDCCPNQETTYTTNGEGRYSFSVPHGIYHLYARAGNLQAELNLDLNDGSTRIQDIHLTAQDVHVE
jgi:Carboxypeptidase regulatory-like domain